MSEAPRRFEYRLRLPAALAVPADLPGLALRRPRAGDAEGLAALMLDAYLGTIDYDGETLYDARSEVGGYLSGSVSPLLERSWLAEHNRDGIVAACLASWWPDRDRPIIAYIMTAADWKGRGLATTLLARSLADLGRAGYADVRAVITAGNLPSEALFGAAGFDRLPSPGETAGA